MHPARFIKTMHSLEKKLQVEPTVFIDDLERVLFVGDIHGDLETVNWVKESIDNYDRIVFLGDYVDRGKDDVDVAIELANLKLSDSRVVLLAGNHDAYPYFHFMGFKEKLKARFGEAELAQDAYVSAFQKAPIAYHNPRYEIIAMHAFITKDKRNWDFKNWKKANDESTYQLLMNDPELTGNEVGFNPRDEGLWIISKEETKEFLRQNKLKSIIRSHEPKINKIYDLDGGLSLVNIGSSAYYGKKGFYFLPEGKILEKP